MSEDLSELAGRVGYRDLRDYLAAHGWSSIASRRDYAAIYRSPGGGDIEVQIPLDTDLADYADAMTLAARRIAAHEGRASEHLLRDLLRPRFDVLRYSMLERSMFEPIERLAQQLEPGRFVGRVIELHGAPNAVGKLEGDVILQVQTDDQLLKVRVTLDPDAYREAGVAHFEQRYVSVRGQLHRGGRTHTLRHPSELAVLPP